MYTDIHTVYLHLGRTRVKLFSVVAVNLFCSTTLIQPQISQQLSVVLPRHFIKAFMLPRGLTQLIFDEVIILDLRLNVSTSVALIRKLKKATWGSTC